MQLSNISVITVYTCIHMLQLQLPYALFTHLDFSQQLHIDKLTCTRTSLARVRYFEMMSYSLFSLKFLDHVVPGFS